MPRGPKQNTRSKPRMIDEQQPQIWNYNTMQSAGQVSSTPFSAGNHHHDDGDDGGDQTVPNFPEHSGSNGDAGCGSDHRHGQAEEADKQVTVALPRPKPQRQFYPSPESYRRASHNHNHPLPPPPPQRKLRRTLNFFSFIKKNAMNKGSFEMNGRHKECFSRKSGMCYVEDLKFPNCVVENLCQKIMYKGQPWFRPQTGDSVATNECFDSIQEKIHAELEDFYSFMKSLREEEIFRKAIFFSIADSIKKLPFVKQVKYYGSYSSKTYLPVSDIDIVVYCHLSAMSYQNTLKFLYDIGKNLAIAGLIEKKFQIIPMSRIPLLKFHDSLTALPINITLETPHVMERSQYIRDRIPINSYEMKLLLFLKYYLLSKGTNQVFHGGIGSYTLALMVIRFFQEESAQELIRNESIYQDSILGYLLMGFLERYGDVDFFKRHVISVQGGGEYIECNLNLDARCPEKKTSVLRIQDSIEPWNDVSFGSFNSSEILKDFQVLHDKFMKGDKCKTKSLFGQVMYVVDSFIEYRILVYRLFKEWFSDYDYKQYVSGTYPIKQKFQEFIEKRKVFQRDPDDLEFTIAESPDTSLECTVDVIRPVSRTLTLVFGTNRDYGSSYHHHRNSRRGGYENRNSNNHVHIEEEFTPNGRTRGGVAVQATISIGCYPNGGTPNVGHSLQNRADSRRNAKKSKTTAKAHGGNSANSSPSSSLEKIEKFKYSSLRGGGGGVGTANVSR